MQGQDGVDLEMNINGTKSTFEDDEFDDVVCFILVFTCLILVILFISAYLILARGVPIVTYVKFNVL